MSFRDLTRPVLPAYMLLMLPRGGQRGLLGRGRLL